MTTSIDEHAYDMFISTTTSACLGGGPGKLIGVFRSKGGWLIALDTASTVLDGGRNSWT